MGKTILAIFCDESNSQVRKEINNVPWMKLFVRLLQLMHLKSHEGENVSVHHTLTYWRDYDFHLVVSWLLILSSIH